MKLTLVLKTVWFNEVVAGRKRVEYRAMTPFWERRIWQNCLTIETVAFSRGYTKATVSYRVTKIDVGPCPYPGWSGNYYRIHFE